MKRIFTKQGGFFSRGNWKKIREHFVPITARQRLVPGTAPALGCTSTRPRGLIAKMNAAAGRWGFFDGKRDACPTWVGRGAHPTAANTEGGKERGMVVSTVQARGLAPQR
jgi:hypothetical protein